MKQFKLMLYDEIDITSCTETFDTEIYTVLDVITGRIYYEDVEGNKFDSLEDYYKHLMRDEKIKELLK